MMVNGSKVQGFGVQKQWINSKQGSVLCRTCAAFLSSSDTGLHSVQGLQGMALPSIPTSEEGGSTTPNNGSKPTNDDPPLLSGTERGRSLMPVFSVDLVLPGMPVPVLPGSGIPSKEWDPEMFKSLFDETSDFHGSFSQNLDEPRFSIGTLFPSHFDNATAQTTEATSGDPFPAQSGGSSAAFSAARIRDDYDSRRPTPAPSPFSSAEDGQSFEPFGRKKRKAVELEQQSSQTIVTLARIQSTAASPSRVAALEGHRSVEPDLDLNVNVHNVATKLPEIPCNIRLTFNSRLTLAPVLLRGREGFIAANVGVRVHRIDHEPSAQLAMHSMLQPSVITTGNPFIRPKYELLCGVMSETQENYTPTYLGSLML